MGISIYRAVYLSIYLSIYLSLPFWGVFGNPGQHMHMQGSQSASLHSTHVPSSWCTMSGKQTAQATASIIKHQQRLWMYMWPPVPSWRTLSEAVVIHILDDGELSEGMKARDSRAWRETNNTIKRPCRHRFCFDAPHVTPRLHSIGSNGNVKPRGKIKSRFQRADPSRLFGEIAQSCAQTWLQPEAPPY